jgi:hypothetical protein
MNDALFIQKRTKNIICLSSWLEKNDFTDFGIIKAATETTPEICTATAEIHFYR